MTFQTIACHLNCSEALVRMHLPSSVVIRTAAKTLGVRATLSQRKYSVMNVLPDRDLAPRTDEGVRVVQMIGLKPEALEEYKKVHEAVWPSVLTALRKANVVDYSIHYFEKPSPMLIAHMRYMGQPEDFQRDMAQVGDDPETHRWWKLTDPMQTSFIRGAVGSASGPGWWSSGEEVFRFEG